MGHNVTIMMGERAAQSISMVIFDKCILKFGWFSAIEPFVVDLFVLLKCYFNVLLHRCCTVFHLNELLNTRFISIMSIFSLEEYMSINFCS